MVAEDFRSGHNVNGIHAGNAAPDQDQATTKHGAIPIHPSSSLSTSFNGQASCDTHARIAVEGSDQDRPANSDVMPKSRPLADPQLALAADVLDDLERTRIANENRLRQLTRDESDADGEDRGFGLTTNHPDVARLASIIDGLAELEKSAIRNLQIRMRAHPLGPWVKTQKGIGEKQAARLLAAIGDPYWNHLHDRPRTVSELWAYCGLHTISVGQYRADTHIPSADGDSNMPGSDQMHADIHENGVAARRQKGQKANWSASAKMRAWNIANSLVKAGIRDGEPVTEWGAVYAKRKITTEGRVHVVACVRCGPSGNPAKATTPWTDAHRHADALRILSKELLKQLWCEAKAIHQG